MEKLLFMLLLGLPLLCSAAYILMLRKIGVVSTATHFPLFTICCSTVFYFAFALSNLLIVRINERLFGVQMHVLDGYGYVVEILVTMSVTVIIYLLVAGFFRAVYRSSLAKYASSVVFYAMNHACISLLFLWTDRFSPY